MASISLNEAAWDTLLGYIDSKECTPFVAAGACAGTVPLATELAERWAEEFGFPLRDATNLGQVAQFLSITQPDPNAPDPMFPKQLVRRLLQVTPPPDFSEPSDPTECSPTSGSRKPDAGEVRVGDTVEIAYVDQARADLSPSNSVWTEISGGYDSIELGSCEVNSRQYVSWFNFKGTDQQKPVRDLSGGGTKPRPSRETPAQRRQPAAARRADERP